MSIDNDPAIKKAMALIGEPPIKPRRVWVSVLDGKLTRKGLKYVQAYQKWQNRVIGKALELREKQQRAWKGENQQKREKQ